MDLLDLALADVPKADAPKAEAPAYDDDAALALQEFRSAKDDHAAMAALSILIRKLNK